MEKLIQIFVISSTIIEDNLAVMGNAHSYNNDEYYENRIAELERRVLEIEQRVFLKMVHNKNGCLVDMHELEKDESEQHYTDKLVPNKKS